MSDGMTEAWRLDQKNKVKAERQAELKEKLVNLSQQRIHQQTNLDITKREIDECVKQMWALELERGRS